MEDTGTCRSECIRETFSVTHSSTIQLHFPLK